MLKTNKLRFDTYKIGLLIVVTVLAVVSDGFSQLTYVYDNSIPVNENNTLLSMPWTGGINGAQFNTIDLNNDRQDDLVLFDRMANQVLTFLSKEKQYVYAPEYEAYFPPTISNWILLNDYNNDGKKDIFTGDPSGMKVFQNVSTAGQPFQWRRYLFTNRIDIALTMGFTQKVNIQMQYDDLPHLLDFDKDGDLDIFKIAFTGNGTIEYHKNFSMERYGTADSLDFVRQTQTWGKVMQCLCDDFAFNGKECFTNAGRTEHTGGKALLVIDLDNDNDHDLLLSESSCNNIYRLTNEGTDSNPVINTMSLYPESPTDMNVFPAAFFEDVDFDGTKDLIVTPNVYRKDLLDMDLKASTWLYKNTGSNALPQFNFIKKDFLQEQMLDVGDNAVPTFADEDNDGDLDLFIGYNSDASTYGSIALYRNQGTPTDPQFEFITSDYMAIKSLQLHNVKPQLVDLNSDGKPDLALTATDRTEKTQLFYFHNTGTSSMQFDLSDLRIIPITIGDRENYHFTDINNDGKPDLLIGRFFGTLEYWRNYGTPTSPFYTLENPSYLNISNSPERLGMTCFAGDLDGDYKPDLIIADAFGKISVINNFREVTDYTQENTNIVFNPLTEDYQSIALGKAWPTAANLFNTKRSAIFIGTIRGGIEVLRNEEKEPRFDELSLSLYPNPVRAESIVYVETNMPLSLQVYTLLGQPITAKQIIANELNTLRFEHLASGLYIFKFSSGNKAIYRRVIFE